MLYYVARDFRALLAVCRPLLPPASPSDPPGARLDDICGTISSPMFRSADKHATDFIY